MTEYRPIPSLPGYLAGSDGSIIGKSGGTLSLFFDPRTRYLFFSAYLPGGKQVRPSAHAAVCEAFHGPCPPGMETAHGNGVRTDNQPGNLSWKTRADNHADKRLHGTSNEGERNTQAKLTEDQVCEIRKLGHLTLKQVGEMYGVHLATIARIRNGRNWKHVR